MRVNGILSYLLSDMLGSSTVALNSDGSGQAVQLFSPYGSVRYSWGSIPATYNFTGQRLDSQTGLLYDNFRYYDPVTGRYVRSDNVQDNSNGMDPYAYVGDNPETRNDPSGHCWPWCTALIGAAIGAAIAVAGEASQHGADWHHYNWGHVLVNAGVGAVAGAMVGVDVGALTGVTVAGPTAANIGNAALIGATTGGASSALGAITSHQSLADGLQSTFEGAAIGGIVGALTAGVSNELRLGGRQLLQGAQHLGRALLQGAVQTPGGMAGNMAGQLWDSWRSGDPNPQFDGGSLAISVVTSFVGGFGGQWAYDHLPVFQTGSSYFPTSFGSCSLLHRELVYESI